MMACLKVIPNFLNLPVEPAVDTMSGINPQIQRLEKVSLLKNSLYTRPPFRCQVSFIALHGTGI